MTNPTLSPKDVAELRELLAKATPGPWIVGEPQSSSRRVFMPDDTVEIRSRAYGGLVACLYKANFTPEQDAANANLIATLHNAAPALLDLASQSLERDGALQRIKNKIDSQLNDYLSNMEEGFDDSVVGFNEAWDIVRKIFKEEESRTLAQQPPAGEN